jgi:Family of unknown function (DUF5681)
VAEDEKNQTVDDVPAGQSFAGIEEPRTESAPIDFEPETSAQNDERAGPNYQVGYKRPPKETRIKPGERRNPAGRPPGSRNLETIVKESLTRKIQVGRGDKIKRVPAMEAIVDTFVVKAAEGDVKAAALVINLATKARVLDGCNDATENEGREPVVPAGTGARPSDTLVKSVDPKRLSPDERIELSKIAEKIDVGGDVIALSQDDFAGLKKILAKGRGKNLVPLDENLKEAA